MPAKSIFSVPPGLPHSERQARRHALLRLGWAWLAMMQVMMFAWPGYVRHDAIAPDVLATLDWAIMLMNWASLVLTVPVVLYSAWPIWQGAARSLQRRQAGMDVPVALGIVAAFVPSVHATVAGHGVVYFDSVTMFVAFLLTARYLAMCASQSVAPHGVLAGAQTYRRLDRRRRALGAAADRLAARFTAAQVALALAAGAAWWWFDPSQAVPVMVALLVISCPCAMAMAVPSTLAAAQAAAHPGRDDANQVRTLLGATRRVARASLYGSVAWHLLMTPLALAGWVAPWLAALTMLLSSLAVAANAWLLYRRYRAPRSVHGVMASPASSAS